MQITLPDGASARRRLAAYLVGAAALRVGDEGLGVALVLLAAARTGSAGIAGALLAAALLPHALSGPLLGALLDRSPRRGMLLAGGCAVFAATLAGQALVLGRTPLAVPLALALVTGALGPLVTGGLTSSLPALVPAAGLDRAHALDAATFNVAAVAGPLVAAGAVALWAPLGVLALGAAAAGGAAAVGVARLAAVAEPAGRVALGATLRAGLAVLWRLPALRATTLATSVAHVGIGGLALAATAVSEELDAAAAAGGVLLAAYAVGALAASLAVARRPPADPDRTVVLGLAGAGACLVAAAAAPVYPVALVLFALAGLCDGPVLAATFAVRAREAPAALRTSVFTTAASLKVSCAALGGGAAGLALEPLSGALVLALLGVAQVAGAAIGILAGAARARAW